VRSCLILEREILGDLIASPLRGGAGSRRRGPWRFYFAGELLLLITLRNRSSFEIPAIRRTILPMTSVPPRAPAP